MLIIPIVDIKIEQINIIVNSVVFSKCSIINNYFSNKHNFKSFEIKLTYLKLIFTRHIPIIGCIYRFCFNSF